MKINNGFTLIEVMITVAVVAILTAIALPSYSDYIRRGKIEEATANLADLRVKMEQYFQDNRTYANVAGVTNPCSAITGPVPLPANPRYFTFACDTPARTATTFTITATGTGSMAGFVYTVNELNVQASVISAPATTAGYASNTGCWVIRRGAANATAACQ